MNITKAIPSKKTMSLKEITDLLDVRHDYAIKKVKNMANTEGFGTMLEIDIVYNDKGQKIKTLMLDKRQSIAVASILNTALLMKIIDRWQELEEKLQPQLPQTFAEALQLAADQAKQIEKQEEQIKLAAPKVDFYDQVTGSTDSIGMDKVAKVLNIKGYGRNKLFQFLRDKSVLQKDNAPYQHYIDRGYFRVIESKYNKPDGSTHISLKTVVYQKGVDYIRKLIEEEK